MTDGVAHGQVAVGDLVDELAAEIVGKTDPPGRAWGELFAGDEPVIEPAMGRGGGSAEDLGGLAHVDQLPLGRISGGHEARDLPVAAQIADQRGGEAMAVGGPAALTVEDA